MVKAYEATIPATRRDTNGGGRRRRTKGDAIDALLALGDNIAKHVGAAIEIANFSQIFALACRIARNRCVCYRWRWSLLH